MAKAPTSVPHVPQKPATPSKPASASQQRTSDGPSWAGEAAANVAKKIGKDFLTGAVGGTIAGALIKPTKPGAADSSSSGKQSAESDNPQKNIIIAVRDLQSDLNAQTAVIRQTNDAIASQSELLNSGFNGLIRSNAQTNTLLAQILQQNKMNPGGPGSGPGGLPNIPDLPDLPDKSNKPGAKSGAKPPSASEKPKPVYNEKTNRFHEPTEPGKPAGKMVSNAEATARGATKTAETAVGDAAKGASKWSKFLTFLERKSPALFKKVGFKIASAAAGLAIPGPGWVWTAVSVLGSLATAWEIYELWQEFSGASDAAPEDAKPKETAAPVAKPETIDTFTPKQGAPIYDGMGAFTGMYEPDAERPSAGGGRGSVIEAPGARAAAAPKTKSLNEQQIDSIKKDHADSDELIRSFAAQMGLPLGAKYTAELRGGIPITINGKPVPRELYTEEQAKRVDAALAMAKLMQDPSDSGSASPVTKSPVNAITSADGGSGSGSAAPKTKSLNDQQIDSIKKDRDLIRSFADQMGLPSGKYTAKLRGGIPITINDKPVPRELYTEEQAKRVDAALAMAKLMQDPSDSGSASPVTKSPVNAITSADGGSGSDGDAKTADMADLDRKEENRRSELKDGDKESITYSAKEMIFKAEKIAFNVQELKFETKAGQPSAAGTPTAAPGGVPQQNIASIQNALSGAGAAPAGLAPGATGSQAGPGGVAAPGGLKGGTFNQQAPEVMNKLMKDFNLTKEQAAGIVGNLGHESAGLQAGIQEKGMKSGRGGLGWAQWTGTRRTAFEKYLKETGQEASDPNANYGFLKKELETTHKGALKAVQNSTDTRGSMVAFEKHYEAAGVKHYDSRQKYADAAASMDLTGSAQQGGAAGSAQQGGAAGSAQQGATTPIPQQGATAGPSSGAAERSASREGAAPAAGAAAGPSSGAAGASIERGALGGNGMIPAANLTPIGAGHKLQGSAAAAYMKMVDAAKAEGVSWGITDSYRSYDAQVDVARRKGLYSQGGLAAKPGTSNHGWGLATDLKLDGKAQQWMQKHAGEYGFSTIPREPWHWEFGKGGKGGKPGGGAEDKTKVAGEGAPAGGALGGTGSGGALTAGASPGAGLGGGPGGNPLAMIGGMLGGGLGAMAGSVLGSMFGGQSQINSMAATADANQIAPPSKNNPAGQNTTVMKDSPNTAAATNKVDNAMPPAEVFAQLFGIGLGAKGSSSYQG